MNARKHLAGFALFSIILGSVIFINRFLTLPNAAIPPVPLRPLLVEAMESSETINYKVQQVSLDFINATGYTTLSLKLRTGQPAPEIIWVTTYYFSPEIKGGGWSSTVQISQPFAKGDQVELVAADSYDWGKPRNGPRVGYFAHVKVSTGYDGDSYPPDVRFNRDITSAIPVVVYWLNE
jgi:hypothetical protein